MINLSSSPLSAMNSILPRYYYISPGSISLILNCLLLFGSLNAFGEGLMLVS